MAERVKQKEAEGSCVGAHCLTATVISLARLTDGCCSKHAHYCMVATMYLFLSRTLHGSNKLGAPAAYRNDFLTQNEADRILIWLPELPLPGT